MESIGNKDLHYIRPVSNLDLVKATQDYLNEGDTGQKANIKISNSVSHQQVLL